MQLSKDSEPPEGVNLVLDVDGDGVVRVTRCDAERFVVTPDQLARLLTGLVAVIVSTRQDQNEVINVSLN